MMKKRINERVLMMADGGMNRRQEGLFSTIRSSSSKKKCVDLEFYKVEVQTFREFQFVRGKFAELSFVRGLNISREKEQILDLLKSVACERLQSLYGRPAPYQGVTRPIVHLQQK